jgi:hypothetical protein
LECCYSLRTSSIRPFFVTSWSRSFAKSLLAIGRTLGAELDAVKQPVSERLAAVLKELERPTAI